MTAKSALRAALLAALVAFSGGALAQEAPAPASQQIVTLDWERLFEGSKWGERVRADLAEASAKLNAENSRIAEELIAEERALTDQRATMDPEAFRAAAEAFDKRTTDIRNEQRNKAQALSRLLEDERQAFTAQVLPLLDEYLEGNGGGIVIDTRAVIRALSRLDVTDEMIALVDDRLGAGAPPPASEAATPATPSSE
ncbi:OmpH family outer membrane protein [Sinirhodobacter sp. WL0062]|uniref:OmpH family outer membrane protein n=1 Tax=Rhodobacter flavimaris TaxID=2907145 RepID=A0ABS8YSI4_9RHOB|nr:OmpH family outer membrane protein [Sinirhodobacter sp. WL0062]MCE5972811.1 OmpH family outer membrane protein [Sinirhodobacter sp. WL0062]